MIGAGSGAACSGELRDRHKASGVAAIAVLLGSGGEDRVYLDRGDPSSAADDLGEDGAIVAGAGADMDDMVATA